MYCTVLYCTVCAYCITLYVNTGCWCSHLCTGGTDYNITSNYNMIVDLFFNNFIDFCITLIKILSGTVSENDPKGSNNVQNDEIWSNSLIIWYQKMNFWYQNSLKSW